MDSSALTWKNSPRLPIIDLQELFGSEGFRRTKDHVPGIVDDDIETAVFLNNSFKWPGRLTPERPHPAQSCEGLRRFL
jgi:hypothetical protein